MSPARRPGRGIQGSSASACTLRPAHRMATPGFIDLAPQTVSSSAYHHTLPPTDVWIIAGPAPRRLRPGLNPRVHRGGHRRISGATACSRRPSASLGIAVSTWPSSSGQATGAELFCTLRHHGHMCYVHASTRLFPRHRVIFAVHRRLGKYNRHIYALPRASLTNVVPMAHRAERQ